MLNLSRNTDTAAIKIKHNLIKKQTGLATIKISLSLCYSGVLIMRSSVIIILSHFLSNSYGGVLEGGGKQ